jgi:glycosyltransferase involved in cell wall biosynthesis
MEPQASGKIRALVISASLPPFNDSSTMQLIERVRRFEEHGIEAVFVGAEMPQGVEYELLQRLPANSTVLRTEPTTYDRMMAWLSRLPGGSLLAWVYGNIMYRIAAPDVRAGWDKQVVRLCKHALSKWKPDIIITSGGSHTAHIAGRQLYEYFSVPWVADLGDPWSLVDPSSWTYVIKARRNHILELQTIPYASGLVFTTEETLEAYRMWLGDKLPKAIVLPPYGYNEDDFPREYLNALQDSSKISLSHIGTAYKGNRNLIPLIQALGSLERRNLLKYDYTLNIIGPHSKIFEKEASRVGLRSVKFSGRVSYKESVDWINHSHILVIVGNTSPLQIPGKVYHYLGSGRPILYIGQLPREQDATARLLAEFPGILYVRNDPDSIASAIEQVDRRYEELWREGMRRLDMTILRKYESKMISEQFVDFLLSVISQDWRGALVRWRNM